MPISRDRIRHTGPALAPSLAPVQPAPHSPAPPKAAGRPVVAVGKPGKGEVVPTVPMANNGLAAQSEPVTVTAACGHSVTFNLKPRQNRPIQTAKHTDRPCGPCRHAAEVARRIPAAPKNLDPERDAKIRAKTKKRYAGKSPYAWGEPGDLPKGAVMVLRQQEDGTWTGEVTADRLTVRTVGIGPARQVPWLAGEWMKEREKNNNASVPQA